MSWESSALYYQIINQTIKAHLGNKHSCQCLLYSVDFAEIEQLQHAGEWEELGQRLAQIAQNLQLGGADMLILCTNTMHKLASWITEATSIPMLHIADATAEAVVASGIRKIGLLGTRFTMTEDFYKERLISQYGLDVIIPAQRDIEIVHTIIYDELIQGVINPQSKQAYLDIISRLEEQGAEGVILGCTEITMLVKQTDVQLPLFDTTQLHAEQAVLRLLAL